jgi:hypothetical protein
MQKNTVSIDTSVIPAKIEFAPEFNVAVSFIDRHLQEGRKDKVKPKAKKSHTDN